MALDVSLLRHVPRELSVGCDNVGAEWCLCKHADGHRRRRVPHYQRGKLANASASFVPNCSLTSCLSSPNHKRGGLCGRIAYTGVRLVFCTRVGGHDHTAPDIVPRPGLFVHGHRNIRPGVAPSLLGIYTLSLVPAYRSASTQHYNVYSHNLSKWCMSKKPP